jgi:glycosyltransferase involved in cell wall biosynthesis
MTTGQTVPVRVIVVEDCGPDATLQEFVKDQFGSRIEYVRNPKRRGLFDNWSSCVEQCRTEWLLHHENRNRH